MGTQEYRKPEWVTHMEELQAALKGELSNIVSKIFQTFLAQHVIRYINLRKT